jgi:hypothetical protein
LVTGTGLLQGDKFDVAVWDVVRIMIDQIGTQEN